MGQKMREQIIGISQQILTCAQNGDLPPMAELVTHRQSLLEQYFTEADKNAKTPSNANDTTQNTDLKNTKMIHAIQTLDAETQQINEAIRSTLSAELSQFNIGKKVSNAYKKTASQSRFTT